MIKLIAIDLDGTFLTDDKQILQENVDAVQAAMRKGIKVVICTGRTLPGTTRFIEAIDFEGEGEFVILQNGAATHRLPDYHIVNATYQSIEHRKLLIEFFFANRFEQLQLVAFDKDRFYLINDSKPNEHVDADSKTLATEVTTITADDFLAIDGIFKMMVVGESKILDDWNQTLDAELFHAFDVVRSQPIITEFLSPGVNKAAALAQLCQDLTISSQEVMALGDENNDLEMLRWAKYSIAMGNAISKVKEVCYDVTDTNNQAGVAKTIKKYILI